MCKVVLIFVLVAGVACGLPRSSQRPGADHFVKEGTWPLPPEGPEDEYLGENASEDSAASTTGDLMNVERIDEESDARSQQSEGSDDRLTRRKRSPFGVPIYNQNGQIDHYEPALCVSYTNYVRRNWGSVVQNHQQTIQQLTNQLENVRQNSAQCQQEVANQKQTVQQLSNQLASAQQREQQEVQKKVAEENRANGLQAELNKLVKSNQEALANMEVKLSEERKAKEQEAKKSNELREQISKLQKNLQKCEERQKTDAAAIKTRDVELAKKEELLTEAQQQVSLEKQKCQKELEVLEKNKNMTQQECEQLGVKMALEMKLKDAELSKKQELLTQAEQELEDQKKKCEKDKEEEKRRIDELLKEIKKQGQHAGSVDVCFVKLNQTQELLTRAEEKLQQQNKKCEADKQEERRRTDEVLEETKKQEEQKRERLQTEHAAETSFKFAQLDFTVELLKYTKEKLEACKKQKQEDERRADEVLKDTKKQEQPELEQVPGEHVKPIRAVEEKSEKMKQELVEKQLENERDQENRKCAEDVMREDVEGEQRQTQNSSNTTLNKLGRCEKERGLLKL